MNLFKKLWKRLNGVLVREVEVEIKVVGPNRDWERTEKIIAQTQAAQKPRQELCNAAVLGPDLYKDSGNKFIDLLKVLAEEDVTGLKCAAESYGNSWKERGGVGAFMMLARKWDRMQNRVKKLNWDIFRAIVEDDRGEGVIDDCRDLRRYLLLVEAEMRARGFQRTHRDNQPQKV